MENHGVSEDVMAEVFRQSAAFFALDMADKMAVKADANNRGYTPMHEQALDPDKQTKGDTKVSNIQPMCMQLLDCARERIRHARGVTPS